MTLTAVAVTDPMPGLSPVTCPGTSLSPGGSETCSATYTTTQADVDRGAIVNTGTASGTPPSGAAVTASSTVTVPAVQAPGINLEKSANVNSFSAAGTVVTYSYTVTNTGNTTLSQVVVTDPMPGLSAITCPFTSLAPAGQETCTATYTTTQADVDAGAITNQGTVTGTPPTGPALTDRSTETIDAVQQPAVGLLKTPSIPSFAVAGTAITYTYEVTNSGNVTLHAITVTDPMPGLSSISCPFSTLAPGESNSCTATYTTTQADVNAGAIANTGTVTATAPLGQTAVDEALARVPAIQAPGVDLAKTSDTPSFASSRHADSVPLPGHQHRQRDPRSGDGHRPDAGAVADRLRRRHRAGPGRVRHVHRHLHHHPGRRERRQHHQHRHGHGHAADRPGGDRSIDGDRAGHPGSRHRVGEVGERDRTFDAPGILITYSYLVRNVGNVDLQPVSVTDPMVGLSAIDCHGLTALSPGQEEVCSATYTTTQADLNAGGVTNTGTAVGTPPTGPDVANTSQLTVPADQDPAISHHQVGQPVDLLGAGHAPDLHLRRHQQRQHHPGPGDRQRSHARPVGPLVHLHLAGRQAPAGTAQPPTPPRRPTWTAGSINNTGTAVGTTPSGPPATATSSVTVPASQTPGIALTKTASLPDFAAPGTTITYSYTVTNSGNLTLNPVKVTDPMADLSPISLSGHDARARRIGDLHRHLHHHPGRRGSRARSPTRGPPQALHRPGRPSRRRRP